MLDDAPCPEAAVLWDIAAQAEVAAKSDDPREVAFICGRISQWAITAAKDVEAAMRRRSETAVTTARRALERGPSDA